MLSNTMRQFNSGDGYGCGAERLEPQHGVTSSLDRSMILLNDVVQVAAAAQFGPAPCRMLTSQQSNCPVTWNVSIQRDLPRGSRSVRCERLAKECLRSFDADRKSVV